MWMLKDVDVHVYMDVNVERCGCVCGSECGWVRVGLCVCVC